MSPARINFRSQTTLLIFILLLAATVRLAQLGTLPPGMFRDETEKAYNAYSILKTGRDVNGQLLPLFIQVLGVTTSAIYQYACIPFIALLGLNEWSARLPAVCVGTFTVLMTFLVAREFRGSRVALWAALLLALSPWHIVFSRWAQQGIFLPLLLSIGSYGLFRFTRTFSNTASTGDAANGVVVNQGTGKSYLNTVWLLLGAFCIGLTTYVYDVARLFAPLLVLAAIVCFWKTLSSKPFLLLAAAFLALLGSAPAVYLLLFQGSAAQARFSFVTIFQPGISTTDVLLRFFSNYFAHWSPSFLLLHGDNELRHGAGTGVVTILEFVGLIAGVYVLAKERRRKNWFWLAWLLVFPVAASLTRIGIPHALRTIVALPAIQVVAAVGLEACTQHIRASRRVVFQQLIVLLAFLAFLPFAFRYFSHQYRVYSAFNWQYGVKQALTMCENGEFRGAKVYMHNVVGAEYLVPFYQRADPRVVQSQWGFPPHHLERFAYLPFQPETRPRPVTENSPTVYVSPPGTYSWPQDWRPFGIFPAEDERFPPVLFLYMNPAMKTKIGG